MYFVYVLKIVDVSNIILFGLKIMVKSGLKKYLWTPSMRKAFFRNYYLLHYFMDTKDGFFGQPMVHEAYNNIQ